MSETKQATFYQALRDIAEGLRVAVHDLLGIPEPTVSQRLERWATALMRIALRVALTVGALGVAVLVWVVVVEILR